MVPVLLGGHNSNSFWLMAITYYVLYSFELSITYYVLVLSIQENFCCAASVLSIATFLHSHIHILGGAMINAVLIQCKLTKLFKNFGACLIKVFLLTGFILLLIHGLSYQLFLKHQCNEKYSITKGSSDAVDMPVNISHIIFALAGFAKGWQDRGPYVDLWWRPNLTRGHVWLDRAPTEYQWPTTSPPFRVSEDASRFKEYDRRNNPFTNRMARMILETFNEGFEGARWFVKADDDSVLFVDNLVELLAKFDHNGYYYIGGNSECIAQNDQHSFNMGFGGGGYAVSYPLAKVLVKNLDGCIKRYPTLYGEDSIMQSCIAELGVPFTREPGFHQIDLHGDISGFLSAHPQAPLISLHHVPMIDPVFPSMSRYDAIRHLMKAAAVDSSRLLQQIICYDGEKRWSVSISWGYSVHIYEELHPPAFLQLPLQTFRPWSKNAKPAFMFNVRPLSQDPCAMPHVFYLESVEAAEFDQIITSYTRRTPWKLASCSNHSVESISRVTISSPAKRLQWGGMRRECCDIKPMASINTMEIDIRACWEGEALIWSNLS